MENEQIYARIHSIETCGTVDGPGVRFVVFFQGCALRCLYCHNPDTHSLKDGTLMSTDELFQEIVKYKSYMHYSHGGVTFTGGEPLLQPKPLYDLIIKCKSEGLHTAIDTSGFPHGEEVNKCLNAADLILLDIKSTNPDKYHRLTQGVLAPTIEKLNFLEHINKKTWIRYVLVPEWTDSEKDIRDLGELLRGKHCVEKVQVLPLHHMGEYKWEQMKLEYQLKGLPIPTQEQILKTQNILKEYELKVE